MAPNRAKRLIYEQAKLTNKKKLEKAYYSLMLQLAAPELQRERYIVHDNRMVKIKQYFHDKN